MHIAGCLAGFVSGALGADLLKSLNSDDQPNGEKCDSTGNRAEKVKDISFAHSKSLASGVAAIGLFGAAQKASGFVGSACAVAGAWFGNEYSDGTWGSKASDIVNSWF